MAARSGGSPTAQEARQSAQTRVDAAAWAVILSALVGSGGTPAGGGLTAAALAAQAARRAAPPGPSSSWIAPAAGRPSARSRVPAQGVARRRAHALHVAAFEAQVTAAGAGRLGGQLGGFADMLRAQAKSVRGDSAAQMRLQRALARQLRQIDPVVAASIRPLLADGVTTLANGEQVSVDPLADDLIRDQLRRVDAKIRVKARRLAADVADGRAPARTDAQIRDLAARIEAVASPAEAAASMVAVRIAALASIESANGRRLVWTTQSGCCGHCTGMSGAIRTKEGLFHPRLRLADKALPWVAGGVKAPPLHDFCRCVLTPEAPGLADALARAAVRDVAAGRVGHLSAPAKARAARRLLRSRAPLTPAAARSAEKLAKAAGL